MYVVTTLQFFDDQGCVNNLLMLRQYAQNQMRKNKINNKQKGNKRFKLSKKQKEKKNVERVS